ncbi:MAG: methyltransferase regulatory domain-containing protein [Rickettsiaceae bacterium]|nr:methyltransferase regulatory domain-containing protein [Rickettsiaceae bacterium]
MTETTSVTQTESANTYDSVPYESVPYATSNPSYMRAVGTLFKMNPAKIDEARILEIGCAGGGNLIPIAVKYPKAKLLGIDLSPVQIEIAQKQAKEVGATNVEFKTVSVTDLNSSYGKFDYIICHGVLSWVPEDVRSAIFKACGELLTDGGLAYISYNTLPGWNMVRTVRDMMLYHAAMFQTPAEKIQQSRLLLDFVKDSTPQQNNPYADMLKTESTILSQQPDHYLFHDHLEHDNKQYYFHEFMAEANRHSLQYVADSNIASMFLGNMPESVSEKLKVVNDIVRTEQYMDFINNRRFRMSILCRAGTPINRDLNIDSVKELYLNMRITPEKPMSEVPLEDTTTQAVFYHQGMKENNISTSSPVMKAALYTFVENMNFPLSFNDVVKAIAKKLPKAKAQEVEQEFGVNALRMVLSGHITISEAPKFVNVVSKKPEVSALVRYQALNMPTLWVTNEMHERVAINIFDKYLLRYLDGKHSSEDLATKMTEHVEGGELNITRDNKALENKEEIKKEITAAVTQTLEKLRIMALLVA